MPLQAEISKRKLAGGQFGSPPMSHDIRTLAALDRVDWTHAKLDALTDVKIQRELEPFRRERL
jgi:hypothetical protein